MKTKLLTTILFALAIIFIASAQTPKPKQTAKKTTSQTAKKPTQSATKKATATKAVIPDVKIASYEDYDEWEDDYYDVYYIADKTTGKKIKDLSSYETVYDFSDGLALVQDYGYKWGFIDKTGKEVIPLKYENANNFYKGLAWVKLNGVWLCINTSGKVVVQSKFENVYPFDKEGFAAVKINGKVGFINGLGKLVIPEKYDYSYSFSEGMAAVCLNNKWGYINKTGKEVIPLIYSYVQNFENGKAYVSNGIRFFYIDKTGKEIKDENK